MNDYEIEIIFRKGKSKIDEKIENAHKYIEKNKDKIFYLLTRYQFLEFYLKFKISSREANDFIEITDKFKTIQHYSLGKTIAEYNNGFKVGKRTEKLLKKVKKDRDTFMHLFIICSFRNRTADSLINTMRKNIDKLLLSNLENIKET